MTLLFNVEADFGDRVVAYLVPDAYSAVPEMLIRSQDGEIARLSANEIREALVVAGRHETGRCGFGIDESVVPGLAHLVDLELREAETGLLIYRRPRPSQVAKKIVRLETHLLPLWRFDQSMEGLFQYHMTKVEAFGHESVTQMFLLNNLNSFYASGRIFYKNYSYVIENGHEFFLIIQDPHSELAERLMILKRIRQVGVQFLSERDRLLFLPAVPFAEDLTLDDDRDLKAAFKRIPDEAARILSNPLTRQLTASAPDAMPSPSALAAALDVLASARFVGLRRDPAAIAEAAAELTGADPANFVLAGNFAVVERLAARLRETQAADELLEKDLELHYYVEQAARRSATDAADFVAASATPN